MSTVVLALDLILALLNNSGKVSRLISAVRAAGRETITLEELQQFVDADDDARDGLIEAIARAKAEGR